MRILGRRPRRGWAVGLMALALLGLSPEASRGDEKVWGLLREGRAVVLLRHAVTSPGVGDPPGFRLEDCATQRNLTDQGRADARRIGAAFRARGIPVGRVLSSRWCRCLETARLAFGRAEPWPELDNLFGRPEARDRQTAALRAQVSRVPEGGNLVVVAHGSNVLPLTGIQPAPGELVVLVPGGPDGFRVAGRLPPDRLD